MSGYAKAVAVIVLVAALAALGYFIKRSGYAQCETTYTKAVIDMQAEQQHLRAEHARALEELRTENARQRLKDERVIQELLGQNKELRAWWNTRIPDDAVRYLSGGLRPADNPDTLRPRR